MLADLLCSFASSLKGSSKVESGEEEEELGFLLDSISEGVWFDSRFKGPVSN